MQEYNNKNINERNRNRKNSRLSAATNIKTTNNGRISINNSTCNPEVRTKKD